MLGLGIACLAIGSLMTLFGFFGDPTVPGGISGRTYNIGLLGMQTALVTSGGALLIAGTVFVVGAKIIGSLVEMGDRLNRQLSVPQMIPSGPTRTGPRQDVPQTQYDRAGTVADSESWSSVVESAAREGWIAEKTPTGMRFRQPTGATVYAKKPSDMQQRLGR